MGSGSERLINSHGPRWCGPEKRRFGKNEGEQKMGSVSFQAHTLFLHFFFACTGSRIRTEARGKAVFDVCAGEEKLGVRKHGMEGNLTHDPSDREHL